MITTADVAAACGVEKATVRSWLARAPSFTIGRYDGQTKVYSRQEGLAMLIAGELISRGLGTPHEVMPVASRIASTPASEMVWVYRDRDGALTHSHQQPHEVAVALPLDALERRLTRTARHERGRVPRYTR
ncbi:MAG: hypothetical protein ACK4P4_02905 [Allorhizobium sp.]